MRCHTPRTFRVLLQTPPELPHHAAVLRQTQRHAILAHRTLLGINQHVRPVESMVTQQIGVTCLPWHCLSNDMHEIARMRMLSRLWRRSGLSETNHFYHGMIALRVRSSPITVRNSSSVRTWWTQRWIGNTSSTLLRSKRDTNDGYGKLVSRFPHLLLTMVPLPHCLTFPFRESTQLALTHLILHASLTGSQHLINLTHVHHTPMTAHQPHTSHHLTYTSLTTSSAYFLTIRKSTILAHTPHTPSQSSA